MRLRLDLSYDGTEFSGWASQPGRRTVQATVESALARLLTLPEPVRLTVAGRTDAGVHATGQVAHFDVDPAAVSGSAAATLLAAPPSLAGRLTAVLPEDIVVRSVTPVDDSFDARFSAQARRYHYLLDDGIPDPLQRRTVVHWSRPLDVPAMDAAAAGLIGDHDFAAYCKRREGATTRRVLLQLDVRREANLVVVTAVGQAFCHNQVRSMVGALLAVGEGRREIGWPAEVLAAGVRDSAITVAPPHGLNLIGVDYPG